MTQPPELTCDWTGCTRAASVVFAAVDDRDGREIPLTRGPGGPRIRTCRHHAPEAMRRLAVQIAQADELPTARVRGHELYAAHVTSGTPQPGDLAGPSSPPHPVLPGQEHLPLDDERHQLDADRNGRCAADHPLNGAGQCGVCPDAGPPA